MTARIDSWALPAEGRSSAVPRRRWLWIESLFEAGELGLFMLSACFTVALVEHPASPLHGHLGPAGLRRLVVGACMGLTAVLLIHSPWGKRSGAHMNPAVTLSFLLLGKLAPRDALLYVPAQFLGASLGVLLARALLGPTLEHPSVDFVRTLPAAGVPVAFAAEVGISALLMLLVLSSQRSPRLSPLTGYFAGLAVALFITLEAPLSGMSMNPARSFGSAVVAGQLGQLWVYLLAPPLGMLSVALAFARGARAQRGCAKLRHDPNVACCFCGLRRWAHARAANDRATPVGATE